MFSRFNRKKWRCKTIQDASLRQVAIDGWDQGTMASARWLFVGAGGNGYVVEGVAKKGMGHISICDGDIVTKSNLNRQKFTKQDLYRPKAMCLARNASKAGFLGSEIHSHNCWFQDLDLDALKPDGIICAVDPSVPGTRLAVAKACLERAIPGVFWAVSTDADWGWVFVQEPERACLSCLFPPTVTRDVGAAERCPGTPASCDSLMVVGGLALYAVDTLVMHRRRDWNYRSTSLSRSEFGRSLAIARQSTCELCGCQKAGLRIAQVDQGLPENLRKEEGSLDKT